jgi:hypothetical protein
MDQWWTPEQLEQANAIMAAEAPQLIGEELKGLERRTFNDFIKFEISDTVSAEPPAPLHESEDMTVVQSPCHPLEPIKVAQTWTDPLYCLVCGASFVV